jgi:putative flippase GtrA
LGAGEGGDPASGRRALVLFRQLLRFALVGSSTAIFDFASYFLLTRLGRVFRRHYLATSFWTATAGSMLSYFFNSRWTFRQRRRSLGQFVVYTTIYVGGILWQNALLWVGVERLHLPDLASKAFAIVLVAVCWNFLLTKLLAFRAGV